MNNQEIQDFIIKYIKPLNWDDLSISDNDFYLRTETFNGTIIYLVENDNVSYESFEAMYIPNFGNKISLGFFHNYYDAKVACQNHHNKILLQDYFKIESVQL